MGMAIGPWAAGRCLECNCATGINELRRQVAQGGGGHGRGGKPARPVSQRPPSKQDPGGLLLTLMKLEKESEGRAYELIKLRTLILKCEKERGDAQAKAHQLSDQNAELEESLARANKELSVIHKDQANKRSLARANKELSVVHKDQANKRSLARANKELCMVHKDQANKRVNGWLEGAKGLSTVLAIGQQGMDDELALESPSQPVPVKSFHDVAGEEAAATAVASDVDGQQGQQLHTLGAEVAHYKQLAQHAEKELAEALAANQAVLYDRDKLTLRVAELEKSGSKNSGGQGSIRSGKTLSGLNPAAAGAAAAAAGAAIGTKISTSSSQRGRQADAVNISKMTDVKSLQELITKMREENEYTLQLKHVEIDHLRYQAEQLEKEKTEAEEKLRRDIATLSKELEIQMSSEVLSELLTKSAAAETALPQPSQAFSDSLGTKKGGPGQEAGGAKAIPPGMVPHGAGPASNTGGAASNRDQGVAGLKEALAKANSELEHMTAQRDEMATQLVTSAKQGQSKPTPARANTPEAGGETSTGLTAKYEEEVSHFRRQLSEADAELEVTRKRAVVAEEKMIAALAELADAMKAAETASKLSPADLAALAEKESRLAAALKRAESAESSLKEAQAQVVRVEGKLSQEESARATLEGEVAEIESKRVAAEDKLSHAESSRASLEGKLAEIESKRVAAESRLSQVESTQAAVECKVADKVADARKHASGAEEERDEGKKQVSSLQAQLAASLASAASSEADVAKLTQLEHLQIELDTLKANSSKSSSKLEAELSQATQEANKSAATVASLAAQLAVAKEETQKVDAELAKAKKDASEANGKLDEQVASAIARLEADLSHAKAETNASTKQLEASLASAKQDASSTKAKLEKELSCATSVAASETARLAAEVVALQAASREAAEVAGGKRDSWQAEKSRLEAAVQAGKEELSRLLKDLESERSAHASTTGSLAEKQDALSRLEAELAELKESHREELARLAGSHEEAVGAARAEHEIALAAMRQEKELSESSLEQVVKGLSQELESERSSKEKGHEGALKAMKGGHMAEVRWMMAKHDEGALKAMKGGHMAEGALKAMQGGHMAEVRSMKAKHDEGALKAMKGGHMAEVRSMMAKHDEGALKAMKGGHMAEVRSMMAKHDEVLKADLMLC
eukprot:gene6169-2783_t